MLHYLTMIDIFTECKIYEGKAEPSTAKACFYDNCFEFNLNSVKFLESRSQGGNLIKLNQHDEIQIEVRFSLFV
jgi:hypothetical protein